MLSEDAEKALSESFAEMRVDYNENKNDAVAVVSEDASKASKEGAKEAAKASKEAAKSEKVAAKASKEAAKAEKVAAKAAKEEAKAEKVAVKAAKEEAKAEKVAVKAAKEASKTEVAEIVEEVPAVSEPVVVVVTAAAADCSESPVEDSAKRFVYEGKTYLRSKSSGVVYDYEAYKSKSEQKVVGKWNSETHKITFEESAVSEEDESDYETDNE